MLVGFVGLLLVVAVAGLFIPVSYVIIEPGDATPVSGVVSVKGAPTYPSRGSLLFLTVSVSNGKPNLWRYVAASLEDDAVVISYHDYFGTTTPSQDRKLNVQAMDNSQQTATKVALEKLGYTVTETGKGARVLKVAKDAPAAGELKVGDVITAVDGQPVTLVEQLGPLVRQHPPGDPVVLTIERPGAHDRAESSETVTVKTAANPNPPNKGAAYLGVVAETDDLSFDFPDGWSEGGGDRRDAVGRYGRRDRWRRPEGGRRQGRRRDVDARPPLRGARRARDGGLDEGGRCPQPRRRPRRAPPRRG